MIFGFMISGYVDIPDYGDILGDFKSSMRVGVVVGVLGLFTACIGGLGIATWKCRKFWFAAPFFILTLLIGLILLIVGVLLLGNDDISNKVKDSFCKIKGENSLDGLYRRSVT